MLEKVFSKFSSIFQYKKFIAIILVAALFIVIALYVYRSTVKQRQTLTHTENKPSPTLHDKRADLYLFYTDWCPFCKKTKPEWAQLKKQYDNGKKVNGYTLNFIEVDCEANSDLANKFDISGYPTIKLVKGNQVVEFDAKPDVKTLEQFLSTVLSN
jgi:thiol-disulfide isomerase/thioredoxin